MQTKPDIPSLYSIIVCLILCSVGCTNAVAAPTYYPTAEQFSDLIAYIESIKYDAAPYGMCRIIPPVNGWKVIFMYIIYLFIDLLIQAIFSA
jgi:jmjN domain